MIIRAVDGNNDWLFGAGLNNYASNNAAIAFLINYRLRSFLGDCFFDMGAGLNWFNLLGSKDQTALSLAIQATIINTPGVTSLLQTNILFNRQTRGVQIQYTVSTVYSSMSNTLQFTPNNT